MHGERRLTQGVDGYPPTPSDTDIREAARALLLETVAPSAPWYVWSGAAAPVASCRVVEPAATCSSFAAARGVARELARQQGAPFVVRRAGVIVARVHPCGICAIPKGAVASLAASAAQ